MNFAKFPFRIVKCANNNFSTGRFKGRISNSLGAQFRQITEKETAARLPLQQWCPRIGGKKLNVPYRRHATLLKLLATVVHGPAVPAVTMKLCTQWGDTTRGGRERCVERRDQNRRKEGEQFRRPNAMTRYIPGMRVYGRMSTILSPLPFDPFFCLSLSLSVSFLAPGSTNFHDYLLPSLQMYFGERSSQWKLDPGSFPFYRTNEHRMARYRSSMGIFQ